jgi:AraC family transcriptional regulator
MKSMGETAPVKLIPDQLIVRFLRGEPGVADFPARPDPVVIVHAGKSVHVACDRAGRRHRGVSVHGDVDIIPAGVPSRWEIREKDAALALVVPASLLRSVAKESGADPDRVEIVNRFQTRDPWLENIGWALKAEMETGYSNGRLYLDGLATALTVHLLNRHSSLAQRTLTAKGGLSGRRLRQVIGFIEDNLGCDLSLETIAQAVGLSASHCKTAFRASLGQPIHQYVIQRRVERARTLLCEGRQSISQIALETGFAHQSHLAFHMRRVLGISPGSIVREEQPQ